MQDRYKRKSRIALSRMFTRQRSRHSKMAQNTGQVHCRRASCMNFFLTWVLYKKSPFDVIYIYIYIYSTQILLCSPQSRNVKKNYTLSFLHTLTYILSTLYIIIYIYMYYNANTNRVFMYIHIHVFGSYSYIPQCNVYRFQLGSIKHIIKTMFGVT